MDHFRDESVVENPFHVFVPHEVHVSPVGVVHDLVPKDGVGAEVMGQQGHVFRRGKHVGFSADQRHFHFHVGQVEIGRRFEAPVLNRVRFFRTVVETGEMTVILFNKRRNFSETCSGLLGLKINDLFFPQQQQL